MISIKKTFWIDAAALALIAALAFLPLVFSLGYYHDDWFTTLSRVSGVNLVQMHQVDRPLMGVIYWLADRLLGEAPLGWHLFAFAARLAGGVAVLWLMRLLWPKQRLAGLSVSALFLVYPGFLLQPNANNYQNHFIALGMAMLSLALTVLSLRKSGVRQAVPGLAAAGLALIYTNIYEGLVGIEGLRLILIYYEMRRGNQRTDRAALRATLAAWPPYLAALLAFAAWRFLIFHSARNSTDAGALFQMYRTQPLQMLARLVFETGRDFIETVVLGWFAPAYRVIARASFADLFIGLLLALAAAGVLWLAWKRLGSADDESGWGRDAILIGALGVLVTLLPVIFSNRDVQFNYNLDRYTLQSIFPTALLVVGLVFAGLRSPARLAVLAALLGLSILAQFSNAAFYRDEWQAARQFWWQLAWRAPALKDGTALVAVMPPDYSLAEGFEIWGPANRIYHPGQQGIAITASILTPEVARQIAHGQSFGVKTRTIEYTVDLKNTLLAVLPGSGACLHVVDGSRVELPEAASPLVRQAARFSRTDLVQTDVPAAVPPAVIFGQEPARSWCYYYESAELGGQRKDWKTIASLGDEAASKGLAPADASEWMPFYEAYARLGRIDDANEAGSKIRASDAVMNDICDQYDASQSIHPLQPQGKIDEYLVGNLCVR